MNWCDTPDPLHWAFYACQGPPKGAFALPNKAVLCGSGHHSACTACSLCSGNKGPSVDSGSPFLPRGLPTSISDAHSDKQLERPPTRTSPKKKLHCAASPFHFCPLDLEKLAFVCWGSITPPAGKSSGTPIPTGTQEGISALHTTLIPAPDLFSDGHPISQPLESEIVASGAVASCEMLGNTPHLT